MPLYCILNGSGILINKENKELANFLGATARPEPMTIK